MKPYFTRYLPVEGQINEHSLVLKDNELAVVVNINANKSFELEFPYGVVTAPVYKVKLAKLFLCSRKIRIGDNIQYDNDKYPAKVASMFDVGLNEDYDSIAFKVIGTVSPDATWVKPGIKFDDSKIKLIYTNEFGEALDIPEARFKGPCGHFH